MRIYSSRSEVTNRVAFGQTTWLASARKSSREFLYMYMYIYIYTYIHIYIYTYIHLFNLKKSLAWQKVLDAINQCLLFDFTSQHYCMWISAIMNSVKDVLKNCEFCGNRFSLVLEVHPSKKISKIYKKKWREIVVEQVWMSQKISTREAATQSRDWENGRRDDNKRHRSKDNNCSLKEGKGNSKEKDQEYNQVRLEIEFVIDRNKDSF